MATCVVVLDKEKTPFYSFGKDPYPNSNFITQKFKLKYNERSGWKIIKNKDYEKFYVSLLSYKL